MAGTSPLSESILLTGTFEVCTTQLSNTGEEEWQTMAMRLVKKKRGSHTLQEQLQAFQPEFVLRAFDNDPINAYEPQPLSPAPQKSSSFSRRVREKFRNRRGSEINTSQERQSPSPTFELDLDRAVLDADQPSFDECDGAEQKKSKEIALIYSGMKYRMRSDSSSAIEELRDSIKKTYDKLEKSFTGCLMASSREGEILGSPGSILLVFFPPEQPKALQIHQIDCESALLDNIALSSVESFGIQADVFWLDVDRGGRKEHVQFLSERSAKIGQSMCAFMALQGRVMESSTNKGDVTYNDRRRSMPPPGGNRSWRDYYNWIGPSSAPAFSKELGETRERTGSSGTGSLLSTSNGSTNDSEDHLGYTVMSPVVKLPPRLFFDQGIGDSEDTVSPTSPHDKPPQFAPEEPEYLPMAPVYDKVPSRRRVAQPLSVSPDDHTYVNVTTIPNGGNIQEVTEEEEELEEDSIPVTLIPRRTVIYV